MFTKHKTGQKLGAITADKTTLELEAAPSEHGDGVWLVHIGSMKETGPAVEFGRIVVDPERGKAAFQPAPFSVLAVGPNVLRALAELLEQVEQGAAA